MYKAIRFNNIFYLMEFLNVNNIEPKNIIGIYREHMYQDQGFYSLLYINKTEKDIKNE